MPSGPSSSSSSGPTGTSRAEAQRQLEEQLTQLRQQLGREGERYRELEERYQKLHEFSDSILKAFEDAIAKHAKELEDAKAKHAKELKDANENMTERMEIMRQFFGLATKAKAEAETRAEAAEADVESEGLKLAAALTEIDRLRKDLAEKSAVQTKEIAREETLIADRSDSALLVEKESLGKQLAEASPIAEAASQATPLTGKKNPRDGLDSGSGSGKPARSKPKTEDRPEPKSLQFTASEGKKEEEEEEEEEEYDEEMEEDEEGEDYQDQSDDDFQGDETETIVKNDAVGYDGIAYDTDDDYDDDEYDDDEDEDEDEIVEARCIAKGLQGSCRKYERVLWQIRGRSYRNALMMLEFMPWRHCRPTLKALQSAAANAQNHFNMDKSRLYITRCYVRPDTPMKRMRPVSKGQAHPYIKHHSHLEIYVAERTPEEAERLRREGPDRNKDAWSQYRRKKTFYMSEEVRKKSKGRHYI